MKILIYGTNWQEQELLDVVNAGVNELGLEDFMTTEITQDESLKAELNISSEPALIIEEESIGFKDMIFEGMIPDIDELKSMFISIVGGGWDAGGCSTGSCGTCSTGCS